VLNTQNLTGSEATIETSDKAPVEQSKVKLVEVDPMFINRHWGEIYETVYFMLQDASDQIPTMADMNDQLSRFLSSRQSLWIGVKKKSLLGYLITSVGTFGQDSIKCLYILYLRGLEHLSDEDWESGYKQLSEYAKMNSCQMIATFSKVQKVVELSVKHGAVADVFVSWRI
jgi:hypothetical protein